MALKRLQNAARPSGESHRFWLTLAAICLVGLGLRVAIIAEFLRENPIAERPWTDSDTYWQMAGEMAAGRWVGDTPFLSAPLYPYCLGLLRTLGGGLTSVYLVQLPLHLGTAVIIASAARRRFSPATGLVAAGLFLCLTDPAVSSTRVLANTVQLLLVALLWWRWVILIEHEARRWRDIGVVGLLIGVLALSYPPAMLLLPAYGVWLWWFAGHGWPAVRRAAGGVGLAALAIAPATLHNAWIAGEFIPISAHGGITLRQGNAAKSRGVYTPVAGISPNRSHMHEDAARVYARVHGRAGSWREIDQYFRQQAVEFWKRDRTRALRLFATKAYWFVTSCHYNDMMPVVLERRYGVGARAVLAPLSVAWLMGAALVGLIMVLRRPVRSAPEWLILGLPFVVVVLFFYSPRYRLPVVPVVCGLAAWALVSWPRCGTLAKCGAVLLIALPLPLYFLNVHNKFDNPDDMLMVYVPLLSSSHQRLGDTRLAAGDLKEAERRYQLALEILPGNPVAHRQVGALRLRQGRPAEALGELYLAMQNHGRSTPEQRQSLAITHRLLFNTYVALHRPREAVSAAEQVITLDPNDPDPHLALAWLLATAPDDALRNPARAIQQAELARHLAGAGRSEPEDVLAAAYAAAGRFDDALAAATTALTVARKSGDNELAEQIGQRLALYRDRQVCRAAPRPMSIPAP
ncbi:MAG: glycosyltransferase family 39 protein [Planctomycetes bacterium]|nr:glycosyltransferase family 39 protein [Planctomycetota bacterium]